MSRSGSDVLARLVKNAQTLLLDFDGPLCDLFGVLRASDVALSVQTVGSNLGIDWASLHTTDPLELVRIAYQHSPEFGREIESLVIAFETDAAASAIPTLGGHEVVLRGHETGRDIVIVSNNAEQPIRTYLERHQIANAVDHVVARRFGEPGRMKPSPFMLHEALAAFRRVSPEALFVGDSVTDMVAGAEANVPCVGYAKGDPDRARALTDSDAAAVILSMRDLERVLDTS